MRAAAALRRMVGGHAEGAAAGMVRQQEMEAAANAQRGWTAGQRAAAARETEAFFARHPGSDQCPACGCCRWESGRPRINN